MTPKRLPPKFSIAFLALVSLFISARFITDSSKYNYLTCEQYGGGPDQAKYFNASEITIISINSLFKPNEHV